MAVYTSLSRSWANPNSDTAFRGWLAAVGAGLDAAGMPRTTDSGQFDPATAAWASVPSSGEGMFEVRELDDAFAQASPIIIKLSYYVAAGVLYNTVRVGVATNGSGTFVGPSVSYASGILYASTTAPLYATCGEGYAGFWVPGAPNIGWFLNRAADTQGQPCTDGFILYHCVSPDLPTVEYRASTQSMIDRNNEISYTFIPQERSSSLSPGTALDVYRHYTAMPDPRINPFALTVHAGEHSTGGTFTADPIQGDVHTFTPVMDWSGASAGYMGITRSSIIAVRWEE